MRVEIVLMMRLIEAINWWKNCISFSILSQFSRKLSTAVKFISRQ